MENLLELLPSSTLLPNVEPHLSSAFSSSSMPPLVTITECEEHYRQKYVTAIQQERKAMELQNIQVKQAIAQGKEKREIRRMKNRLSAVRSRARKDAEGTLNTYRLKSLEAQIEFLSTKLGLQKKNNLNEKERFQRERRNVTRRMDTRDYALQRMMNRGGDGDKQHLLSSLGTLTSSASTSSPLSSPSSLPSSPSPSTSSSPSPSSPSSPSNLSFFYNQTPSCSEHSSQDSTAMTSRRLGLIISPR